MTINSDKRFKMKINTLALAMIPLLFLGLFGFLAFTSWSMPSSFAYGEYVFSTYDDEFTISRDRLVYEAKEGYKIRVIALKEREDIEAFICDGNYNWDRIKPDKCKIESETEESITIYSLSKNLGDDSVAEKEIKFTFSGSAEGFYLSKREVRQKCVSGRGWSISLYPGNCS